MANLLEIANHGITSSRPVASPAVTDGRERIGRGDARLLQRRRTVSVGQHDRAIDLIARFLDTIRILVNEHDAPPLGDKRARQLHPDETRSNDNDLLYWNL